MEQLLGLERAALDRWSGGDPMGYAMSAADDITYFDDIGAKEGVFGVESARAYLKSLAEVLPPHHYEMVGAHVQVYGDTGVLSFQYHPSTEEGAGTPWRASTVYVRQGDEWRMVHAHWTMMKEA
jgi:hypothetical protein